MKKTLTEHSFFEKNEWRKTLLIPKCSLVVFLFIMALFSVSALSHGQNLTLMPDSQTAREIIRQIESETNYRFFYNEDLRDLSKTFSFATKEYQINEVLDLMLLNSRVTYKILDNDVVVITPLESEFQQKTVRGTVSDINKMPLPGVTVMVRGTTQGTTTNVDGEYILTDIPGNAVLMFSFVGLVTREIVVGDQTVINLTMEEDFIGIEEVVTIAYGTQNRREVTGSIVNFDTRTVEDLPTGQITQRLQGKIAGAQLNIASGNPGQDIEIRIRGAASINAGNDPLYVVDGFPIVGNLSDINPNEIENISILKGSSAASLYGSRAANGVVLITTKRAKGDQNLVQFSYNYGITTVPQQGRYDLMNAREFLQFQKEIFEDKIRYEGRTAPVPELYQNPDAWAGPEVDWYDALLRSGHQKTYNLTLLHGRDRYSSATTVGYYSEEGVVINSDYKRYSFRSNNDYIVNDNIRLGFNVAPSYQASHNISGHVHTDFGPAPTATAGNTEGFFGMLYSALVTPTIFSPEAKNPDGSPVVRFNAPGTFTFPNWVHIAENRTDNSKKLTVLSNAFVEADFLRNFHFRGTLAVNLINQDRRQFYPSTTGSMFSPPPRLAQGMHNDLNSLLWLNEYTLRYTNTVATNHNFDVLVGYSAQDFSSESASLSGDQFPDDLVPWLSAAARASSWSNTLSSWSLISMFSRLNYNYKGKYLISASLRSDGSSRFGVDNRWGSFPSISAGWIISDENFADGWSTLSYLKLRAEWGIVGNFNIGDYRQYPNMSNTNYVFGGLASGRSPSSIGNAALTWETTEGINLGLDLAAFRDRVSFAFDYYNKTTSDMLYQIDIPRGSGFGEIQSNIGEFNFWGYEFALRSRNMVGNFNWSTDLNVSLPRNLVKSLGTNDQPIGAVDHYVVSNSSLTAVGHPIGMLYGFVSDGVYMTQEEFDNQPKNVSSRVGSARYLDLSGPNGIPDGIIDIYDRTFIGNPNPKVIFGFSNNFAYKNFDLNIIMAGAYGQDKILAINGWVESLEGLFRPQRYLAERWRSPENPGAGIIGRTLTGSTAFNRVAQSRYVQDASYLTVKNITLGYTLPRINYVRGARVYLSIQQALVITKYQGSQPETSVHGLNALNEGIDAAPYPVPRTISLGVNLNL
jgi:TonB-dependent starch-binding outer membrane protein SusC